VGVDILGPGTAWLLQTQNARAIAKQILFIFLIFIFFLCFSVVLAAIPVAIQDMCCCQAAVAAIARGNFDLEWYSTSSCSPGFAERSSS
jgi:hypothetical protein